MRLGLIGLGGFHAETLSHLAGVDSLVVTDAVPALTARVAERYGVEAGLPGLLRIAEAAPPLSPQRHRPVRLAEVQE